MYSGKDLTKINRSLYQSQNMRLHFTGGPSIYLRTNNGINGLQTKHRFQFPITTAAYRHFSPGSQNSDVPILFIRVNSCDLLHIHDVRTVTPDKLVLVQYVLKMIHCLVL